MRRALDSRELFPRLFAEPCRFVEDDAGVGAEVPRMRWIQVAREGLYEGHWQGSFNLTPDVFRSFVKNLRAHPQYKAGDIEVDGKVIRAGTSPTIPFDYEHSSEMSATEGSIPQQGAPAPAWVYDIEMRQGEAGAELWALAWLGDQIRRQISAREYRQTSIAFDMESADFRTNAPAGPALTSIAFTNHPFLRHLESYAAANRRSGQAGRGVAEHRASKAPDEPQQRRTVMGASDNDSSKTEEKFRQRLCKALGIRLLADDEAIAEAAGEASAGTGDLDKVLKALGVSDSGAAMEVIPRLRDGLSRLEAAEAELREMLGATSAQDEMMSTADIGAALKALKKEGDKSLGRALSAFRAQCLRDAETAATKSFRLTAGNEKAERLPFKALMAARAEGRRAFLSEYGIREDVDTSHLTRTYAASAGGGQHLPPRVKLDAPGAGDRETVNLSDLTGDNPTDKIVRYLGAKDPAFKALSHRDRIKGAVAFMQKNDVVAA